MGIFSIVVGLIVFAVAMFPNLAYFVLIPAAAGLIIGLCKIARDGYCPWSLAGVVLNSIAMLMAFFWTAIITFTTVEIIEEECRDSQRQPEVLQIFYPVMQDNHPVKKLVKPHTHNESAAPENTQDAKAPAAQK